MEGLEHMGITSLPQATTSSLVRNIFVDITYPPFSALHVYSTSTISIYGNLHAFLQKARSVAFFFSEKGLFTTPSTRTFFVGSERTDKQDNY